MASSKNASAWDEIYEIVRRIPPGCVMNYGQIARGLARPLSARAVGWALHQCPEDVPWHRVVNASGGCSTDTLAHASRGLQRALLEAEGIEFRANGTLDLVRYRWAPVGRAR